MRRLSAGCLLLLLLTPVAAQTPMASLTVDGIMKGPALVGYPPSGLRWSGDSAHLYFEWRGRDDDEPSTWVVSRTCLASAAATPGACAPRRLSDEERKLAPPPTGTWDRQRRRLLAVQDGDIVLFDTVAGTRTDITRTVAAESSPRWTDEERGVSFVRENSLYRVMLGADGDGLQQITDAGPARREPALTESQKFLEAEEQQLLDFVREAQAKRKKAEAKREKEALPKLELAERQSAPDLQLAHENRFVYALVVERAQNARRADVPNYVTTTAYAEQLPSRAKVGDAQDGRRLAILNLSTKKQIWASLPAAPSPPTTPEGSAAADRREGGPAEQRPEGPGSQADPPAKPDAARKGDPASELRWSMPIVTRDGRHAVATVTSGDNEQRWIVLIDPQTGGTRVLDHLRDQAWVRTAGGFGPASSAGFLPDNARFWFLSERDGWMHLYIVDVTQPASSPRQLTSGRWEITGVELSPDERRFLITSTEAHPGERHVYAMPVDGGARTKLTTRVGANSLDISPDGAIHAIVHSTGNRPPEVFLLPAAGGAPVQVTTSPTAEWLAQPWVEPQLITYKARDGAEVYARLYTPEMVGAKRHPKRPAVVFVHGAGYLQNAHRYWSTYYREYMFHHLLAARGYVVLDPDYRASAGYGRDWRTAIYRHMGGKDLEDVVDGAAWLAKTQKVDASRIGVYGGSYGGFITLMAMFTTPDVFAAGAALRPVTDWAHYSHGYTSSILNEPQTDAAAYRRSSPIHFAQGLEGALLICHGMVDVNVHFQDSVRLAQRLIELRKENWELAVYPVEDHAFEQETSWADEYKRVLKLFEAHLKK